MTSVFPDFPYSVDAGMLCDSLNVSHTSVAVAVAVAV
jgi:hypothetical protein